MIPYTHDIPQLTVTMLGWSSWRRMLTSRGIRPYASSSTQQSANTFPFRINFTTTWKKNFNLKNSFNKTEADIFPLQGCIAGYA